MPGCTIPNVVGLERQEAISKINAAGFENIAFNGAGNIVESIHGPNGEEPHADVPCESTLVLQLKY